jgi:hypothetical protein
MVFYDNAQDIIVSKEHAYYFQFLWKNMNRSLKAVQGLVCHHYGKILRYLQNVNPENQNLNIHHCENLKSHAPYWRFKESEACKVVFSGWGVVENIA